MGYKGLIFHLRPCKYYQAVKGPKLAKIVSIVTHMYPLKKSTLPSPYVPVRFRFVSCTLFLSMIMSCFGWRNVPFRSHKMVTVAVNILQMTYDKTPNLHLPKILAPISIVVNSKREPVFNGFRIFPDFFTDFIVCATQIVQQVLQNEYSKETS